MCVILEDIIDTGKTMDAFLPQLEHQQPASLKIAALLHKPEATFTDNGGLPGLFRTR